MVAPALFSKFGRSILHTLHQVISASNRGSEFVLEWLELTSYSGNDKINHVVFPIAYSTLDRALRIQAKKVGAPETLQEKGQDWKVKLQAMLEKKGLTWQQCTVPESMRGPYYDLLPMRERKTLGFKLLVDPDAKSVDIGQTVDRCSVGRLDDKGNMLLPTLTPGSKTWLVDQRRTLHS